jgi:hypothetical protein
VRARAGPKVRCIMLVKCCSGEGVRLRPGYRRRTWSDGRAWGRYCDGRERRRSRFRVEVLEPFDPPSRLEDTPVSDGFTERPRGEWWFPASKFSGGEFEIANRRFGTSMRLPVPPLAVRGYRGSWCGMRGIVTLAAALTLLDGFPERDLTVFAAFCVVLGTLALSGFAIVRDQGPNPLEWDLRSNSLGQVW